MRRLLIKLHVYTGLAVGVLLVLTGLTGSLLVFDHALDEVLAPETVVPGQTGSPAPLAEVLAAARAAVPGESEPTRLHLARQPGSPHVVRFPAQEGAPGPVEVSVSPGDAGVLAVRTWGEYPMSWLYRLHYTLLAGAIGKYIVGVGGLFLLFFCFSGSYLWWPRRLGHWRKALTIKRGGGSFRFNLDLHRVLGIFMLPVMVLVAFSGVSLVFPGAVKGLAGTVLAFDERPNPVSVPGSLPLSIDEAVTIGLQVFPGAELKRVFLPQGPTGTFELAFKQPGEPWSSHAVSSVWVDQYSGAILAVWDAMRIAPGNKFLAWQFPLHNGDALGLAGRWLIFLTGPVPALLFGTGFYLWWRKRRKSPNTQPIMKR